MTTLRQRIYYNNPPLFPKPVSDLTLAEQWEEARECALALVMIETSEGKFDEHKEEVQARKEALRESIEAQRRARP